ncbi:hypothetical protein SAMN02745146_1904 [Hymenobacter daecheongensis DSM 21074]|uniref:CsgH-like domain-containing protein n=1 Tax=Hymenobacter daecheongensis DSM 21074 TaxID=1121955 RepID=A0A1M6F1Q6_9BACT|nr:curli-like amyloid fiber formation chaperone CsgH [Hymenobacter daecheongensis]SHI91600.1 hypothetical protein SAMN02745146_1904 [Hymenobacter daecheongensis DSM 21074]
MKSLFYIAALPVLAALAQAVPPAEGPTCQAQLAAHLEGNQLTLVGHCRNDSEKALTLRYELLTDKRGPAGTSRNTQSGTVTVAPRQTVALSQTSISVSPADFYQVHLHLLDAHGTVVARDSLVHAPASRP